MLHLVHPTHGFVTSVFVELLLFEDFESRSGVDPQAASRPRAAEIARNFFMAFAFCCRNLTLPWQPGRLPQPDSCCRLLMKRTFSFYHISEWTRTLARKASDKIDVGAEDS